MIEKDYVLQMARYNALQNNQLRGVVQQIDEADVQADRGAFFGSIFATLNHILWGDTLWMSRWCSDVCPPAAGAEHTSFTLTTGVWESERFRMDDRIRNWAQTLSNMDLRSDLEWHSQAAGMTFTQPLALCVAHMFNHQTHHRGQISQMLSAAGMTPPVSDLVYLPEDA
ncbi:DinB family protein [Sulfitobacter sp.]|uniref:DinB family protein n=1 Tax=Sulfitobacter sp. TaxID=1903071 RepID=UPI00300262EC